MRHMDEKASRFRFDSFLGHMENDLWKGSSPPEKESLTTKRPSSTKASFHDGGTARCPFLKLSGVEPGRLYGVGLRNTYITEYTSTKQ